MGCAREGGVGTEVRYVGKVRQLSPRFGVDEIGGLDCLERPPGTTSSIVLIGDIARICSSTKTMDIAFFFAFRQHPTLIICLPGTNVVTLC